MARYNLLALVGAVVCLLSVPILLWNYALMAGISSADTDLDTQLRGIMAFLSIAFLLGSLLALRTTVAGILLVPMSITMAAVELWYYYGQYDHITTVLSFGFMAILMALAGSAMVLNGLFLQVSQPGHELYEGEELLTLAGGKRDLSGGLPVRRAPTVGLVHLPHSARRLALLGLVIAIVASLFTVSIFVTPVSKVKFLVAFNQYTYGPDIRAALYVDGKLVTEGQLHQTSNPVTWDPWPNCTISAGTHELAIDFASGASAELDGVMDYERHFKVLPFTTELQIVGIDVGFA